MGMGPETRWPRSGGGGWRGGGRWAEELPLAAAQPVSGGPQSVAGWQPTWPTPPRATHWATNDSLRFASPCLAWPAGTGQDRTGQAQGRGHIETVERGRARTSAHFGSDAVPEGWANGLAWRWSWALGMSSDGLNSEYFVKKQTFDWGRSSPRELCTKYRIRLQSILPALLRTTLRTPPISSSPSPPPTAAPCSPPTEYSRTSTEVMDSLSRRWRIDDFRRDLVSCTTRVPVHNR
jgi:hypothetical protein